MTTVDRAFHFCNHKANLAGGHSTYRSRCYGPSHLQSLRGVVDDILACLKSTFNNIKYIISSK